MSEGGFIIHPQEIFGGYRLISGSIEPIAAPIEVPIGLLYDRGQHLILKFNGETVGFLTHAWRTPLPHNGRIQILGRINCFKNAGSALVESNAKGKLFLNYTVENGIMTQMNEVELVIE